MKRLCNIIILLVVLAGLTACGNSNQTGYADADSDAKNKKESGAMNQNGQPKENTNILVAYFSCTGTTKPLAEYAAGYLNADLYEIVAETPYSSADLDYNKSGSRANREQDDSSHSSGIGSSDTNLHSLVDSSVEWKEGKRFAAGTSENEITGWLDEMGVQPFVEKNSGQETAERVFDFEKKTVTLNSGYEMPLNGLGTYSLEDDTCVSSVSEALKRGVRLIDTAYMYDNEKEVGKAVRESGIPRKEIFVTTKLYPDQYDNPEKAINDSLKRLDIGYIDLLLLHHPGENDVTAYKAMEKAVRQGKVRSIGLSNWYIEELQEFLPQVTITPAVVQNEIHPYYQESKVIDYVHSLGIVMEGWYPFGGRGYTKELLTDKTIAKIAKAHDKSVAQVILRWNLQKGVVVIPGSSNPAHIQENTEIYDFTLSKKEMKQINGLNRDEKHDWY